MTPTAEAQRGKLESTPAAGPQAGGLRGRGRTVGLGSVFGKTVRDSLGSILAVATLLCGLVLVGGWTMLTNYGTPAARAELAVMSTAMPAILRGLYGDPVRLGTLGGFISWHYGAYFLLLGGLWSIVSLSGTLAGEARRGSLDLTAVTPLSRAAIATQKAAGHIAALSIVAMAISLSAWVAGAWLAKYPGDEIAADAAAAFGIGFLLRSLIAGALAFALAPLLGRGAAAAIAGTVMVAGYLAHSYRTVVQAFDVIDELTWFGWASGHRPLVGEQDWLALALTMVVAVAFLAAGVVVFERRDVGVILRLPLPRPPQALLGVGGPVSRAYADLLPTALAWGVGLGAFGLVFAASSRAIADVIASSPEVMRAIAGYLPGTDFASAAGMLQFAFVDLGLLLVGLAAAALVGQRSADEDAGRLELQLTTPLSRWRWTLGSGVAVVMALATINLILAPAIAAGVLSVDEEPLRAVAGTLVLTIYGSALAGIGLAVAGLGWPHWATRIVVAIAVLTTLVDLLAPALRLPPWVESLALTHHLGQPMLGRWDPAGIAACLLVAVAGIAASAWGMRGRDITS